jgi:hypothetical protein
MGPVSPSGPSRPRSTDAFDFDAANLDIGPRPPAGARRLSGTARRTGPAATTTGLNLWSAITLPVRLVIGILSGTWYFLGKDHDERKVEQSTDLQYRHSCRYRSSDTCLVSSSHRPPLLVRVLAHLAIPRPRHSRLSGISSSLQGVQPPVEPCWIFGSDHTASFFRTCANRPRSEW